MSFKSTESHDKVVTASLEFAAAGRWRHITMPEIAGQVGISLSELYQLFPTKSAIITAFVEKIDRQVMAKDFKFEDEDTPRDRLFEILMCRFDALRPYRVAVGALSHGLLSDPIAALYLGPAAINSSSRMLATAGISSSGPFGLLRAKGLLAVWLATLRVWLPDDSPDLSRTMATLDRYLLRAERAAIELERFNANVSSFGNPNSTSETDVNRE